ncbi:IS481 family transposase [Kangiella sp.]|uniref:IS481 family transposase n=1 Tax=Kangiella sp. TaxID=1920245 RepID=UPI0019A946D6|nr:IS481 family transposase [Kangiella sp.]MBD3652328.1 transposase [Kangiella sp.]
MPWNELKPMDQRIHFISGYLNGNRSFSQLCQSFGISRKTGYKWVRRYQELGVEGLVERSRRPHSHSRALPRTIQRRIIKLRTESLITPGAKKIQARLRTLYPDVEPPSISCIYNILNREGLVHKQRKRCRVPLYTKPLLRSAQPNDLWSVDFKGQFKLGNGQWCYPLTVMDDFSRYLIGCVGQKNVRTQGARVSFKRLFQDYGLPLRIRSDNGAPFASRATAGLSSLSVWWIKLGIIPERIAPGKPQQNGKHERMHRTLKEAATRPPCTNFSHQQHQFERFKQEYNQERPHESLAQQTPDSCYHTSTRPYPKTMPKQEYPSYFEVKKVRSSGVIYWRNGQVYISHLLNGEWIGLYEVDDGIFNVYFGCYKLGSFDIRKKTVGACNYWSLKV